MGRQPFDRTGPVRRAGAAAMPDTRPQIFERPGRDEERKFGIWAAARRHDDFSSNRHDVD